MSDKLVDYQFNASLYSVLRKDFEGVPRPQDCVVVDNTDLSAMEYIDILRSRTTCFDLLPSPDNGFIVYPERTHIVNDVVKCNKRGTLYMLLEDMPEIVTFFMDSGASGYDALFVGWDLLEYGKETVQLFEAFSRIHTPHQTLRKEGLVIVKGVHGHVLVITRVDTLAAIERSSH